MFLRALTGVGLATILYKALAALQQLLIARVMGASEAADAFFLAQAVPVLLAGLLFSSISTSVVFLSREQNQDGLLRAVAVFSLSLVAAAWLLRGLLVPASAERIFTLLLPVLALQPVSGFLTGRLMSRGRVVAPPLSMCLFYGCGLAGLALASPHDAAPLAIGLSMGSALQAVVLFGISGVPLSAIGSSRALLFQALPALGCNAISTLLLVADRDFATAFGAGSVASISYVYSLITMPTQIIVNSVVGVCLPSWTTHSNASPALFRDSVSKAVALLCIALLPLAIFLALGADPITSLALGSTRFTPEQIASTSVLLVSFTPAVIGFAAKDTLTAMWMAKGKPMVPFAAGIAAVALSIALKPLLSPALGMRAAAAGTGIGLAVCSAFLMWKLRLRVWTYTRETILAAAPAWVAGYAVSRADIAPEWVAPCAAISCFACAWFALGGMANGRQILKGSPTR